MSDQKPRTNEERLERANQLIGRISAWTRIDTDDATRLAQIQRLIAEFERDEREEEDR